MAAPPPLNPFYIEHVPEWQGDYDWRNDEEYSHDDDMLEQEGLLSDDEAHRHIRPADAVAPPRKRRRVLRCRVIILFGCVFLLFFILLMYGDDSSKSNKTTKKHQDGRWKTTPDPTAPSRIVVLGERHSGVPWLAKQLQGLFVNTTVTTRLVRDAPWFQDDIEQLISTQQGRSSFVVLYAVRNPYDWIEQLRQHPLYAPAHKNIGWHDFVTQPWTMQRPSDDVNTTSCQLGFDYQHVMPCRGMSSMNNNTRSAALYELQRNGQPFDNVLDLRAAKIRHVLDELEELYDDDSRLVMDGPPVVISYESSASELERLLEPLQHILVHDATFTVSPPMDDDSPRHETPYVQWMNAHVDWTTEGRIGYQRWGEDQRQFQEP